MHRSLARRVGSGARQAAGRSADHARCAKSVCRTGDERGNVGYTWNADTCASAEYVAATIGSGVLVEANTFENVDDPYHLAEGDSSGGSLVARDNCLIGETNPGQTGGSVRSIPYSYSAQPCSAVKAAVMAGAGVGRISV